MAEFWSWDKFGAAYSCTEMASAAHVYGKRILGAEAFTAGDGERWQRTSGGIKALGDRLSARASTALSSTATRCSPGPTAGGRA